jgi:CheY-like chemotaxis protein
VRQILSSLIGNAVKYTARGRIEVRVLMGAPDRVRIEVADTGPGLSAEELERAFEPFSRIERVGLGLPGAGLGLPLSRELARLMGGEVSGESAVGVGSRFWFDIPYDPAAVAEDDADTLQLRPDGAPAAAARGLRVLIVEPDSLGAAMLRAIVEQLGHQVVLATNARRAGELAELCPFDLVMADARLTGQPEGPASEVPTIALIGEDAEEAEACLEAGVGDVLRKPATVASVARAIATALERGGPPRSRHRARKAAAAAD